MKAYVTSVGSRLVCEVCETFDRTLQGDCALHTRAVHANWPHMPAGLGNLHGLELVLLRSATGLSLIVPGAEILRHNVPIELCAQAPLVRSSRPGQGGRQTSRL